MKKILCVLILLLSGCQSRPQYYLYVYFAKTCPVCQSFIKHVVPLLEEEYGNQMIIIEMDIDEEKSLDAYAKTCSLLEDYVFEGDAGSVPFIVLDGYFAKIGYDIGESQQMVDAVHDAIEGRELSSDITDIYKFKEGKTFHEGGN
ncbi:hypothetical protein [Candidatus Stoquefichus massiliensis]|uniref:hypothetical protein n=1 Tax=Candidatus Stoquefichus massiliensis TaxID=1470350 RepID=UPI000488E105|nr:hypothetical protein [Candidatus Stoquefichus massiliensis]